MKFCVLTLLTASLPLVTPLAGCLVIAEGEGGPCTITDTIDEARTLSPDECASYAVIGDVRVDANLVIAAGTTLVFGPGAGVLVGDTGSLSAVGTADARITLRGEDAGVGTWAGVNIRSNSPENALKFVDVDGAGGRTLCCDLFSFQGQDARAALIVGSATDDNGASVSIEDSTFTNSGGDGIDLYLGSSLTSFQRNTFRGNDDAPIVLPLSQIPVLDATTDYVGPEGEQNGEPFVVLLAEELDEDLTIQNIDVPFVVEAGVADAEFIVRSTLTISAGVTLAFDVGGGFKVEDTGSLQAIGTPADPVRIVGREAGVGQWAGISLRSTNNTLSNAVVDGGGGRAFCCDYFDDTLREVKANIVVGAGTDNNGAAVTFNSVQVSNSAAFGVYRYANASVNGIGTVTFSGNEADQN